MASRQSSAISDVELEIYALNNIYSPGSGLVHYNCATALLTIYIYLALRHDLVFVLKIRNYNPSYC